ncbi:MAG: Nif11-like leader peptide family RiPP precursor [Coleofasciculus sp. F4-SAH-05]
MQNDQHLQDLLGDAPDQDSFTDLAVRLGEEKGYSFTAEDVKAFINRKTTEVNLELQDEELEAVAGGKKKCLGRFTTVCFISRQCWGSYC